MTIRYLIPALLLLLACTACGPDTSQAPPSPAPDFTPPAAKLFDFQYFQSATGASLRGASVGNAGEAWVSGSGGTVLRTTDFGSRWQAVSPPDAADSLDFRDVHCGGGIVVLMSAGEGAQSRIFFSEDGGKTWTKSFQNTFEKGFLNAIAFAGKRGMAFGDAVSGKPFLLFTEDEGRSWKRILPVSVLPDLPKGEHGFAASGTCLLAHNDSTFLFGTGGDAARIYRTTNFGKNWDFIRVPFVKGQPSAGIFSLSNWDGAILAVGGDYARPDSACENLARSADGGKTWQPVSGLMSLGYFSGSAQFHFATGGRAPAIFVVGPRGSAFCRQFGESWQNLDFSGYHTVAAGTGFAVAAGSEGRVASIREK